MKRIIFTLALVCALQLNVVMAQRTCATDDYNKDLMQQLVGSKEAKQQFDAQFKEYLKGYNLDQVRNSGKFGKSAPPKYIIPVVVHVFHDYGEENISNTQIISEIDFLNLSFKRLNADTTNTRPIFRDIAGNANIEFRLARKDPNGNRTDGIVRHYSPLTDRGDDNLKKESVWDSKRYFNMWIVKKISKDAANPNGLILGYAQFPFFGGGPFSASTDGIMINYRYFGQTGVVAPPDGVYRVTATHEAGHWLGLYHPFQGDSCDLENDGINETPPRNYDPSNNNPNFCNSVNKDSNTCTNDNPDLPDQYENYMDYFTGSCSNNMFTSQQVARMHFCLETYRPELISTDNAKRTGVDDSTYAAPNPTLPVASFDMHPNSSINVYRTCMGKSVAFEDNSYNSTISARSWNFGEGATPQTSTVANPTGIVYSTSGYKTITLTVTGPNGSTTITKENYLYVEGSTDSYSGSVHTADWDYVNDFLQKGWYFENETKGNHWVRTTEVLYDGNATMRLNFTTTSTKFNYSIISPSYNLTNAPNPYISFVYSFAPSLTSLRINNSNQTGDSQDGLMVYVSTDCGKSWLQRFKVSGNPSNPTLINPMSTLPSSGGTSGIPSTVAFTPGSREQWKSVSVQGLSNISAANNIRFKITFNDQGGNNFYIDNLMVGMSVGVNEITANNLQFSAYPNPFNLTTTLEYFNPIKADIEVKLYDVVGKEVATLFSGTQEIGKQKLVVDKQALNLHNGVYFVKIGFSNAMVFTHKLIVN